MAVKTREELMQSVKTFLGDDTSDEALALVQDISDTLGDSNAQKVAELQGQLEEQDKAWRKKYRDAFFSGADEQEEEKTKKPKSFADLFTTE